MTGLKLFVFDMPLVKSYTIKGESFSSYGKRFEQPCVYSTKLADKKVRPVVKDGLKHKRAS